jgi:hypothetical protein
MGNETMGVKMAALPAQELLQVDVELRLKDPDSDGARADAATDIRQEVIGVIEVEDKAFALEIRP